MEKTRWCHFQRFCTAIVANYTGLIMINHWWNGQTESNPKTEAQFHTVLNSDGVWSGRLEETKVALDNLQEMLVENLGISKANVTNFAQPFSATASIPTLYLRGWAPTRARQGTHTDGCHWQFWWLWKAVAVVWELLSATGLIWFDPCKETNPDRRKDWPGDKRSWMTWWWLTWRRW